MTIEMTPPSVLSSPQRRCQVLLMLALPGHTVTTEIIRAMNGVDEEVTRQDIAEGGAYVPILSLSSMRQRSKPPLNNRGLPARCMTTPICAH